MPRVWTDNQRRAITTRDRDVCVAAGAGSGKTGVLVERFVHIVRDSLDGSLPPERRAGVSEILVITFTEKATKEMKGRIVSELDRAGLREARREVETAYISTIHGFCSRLLKENPFEAGVDPEFVVLDPTEARRLLRLTFEQVIERAYAEGDEAITELVATVQDERVFGTDVRDPLSALAAAVAAALDRVRGAGHRLEDIERLREQGGESIRRATLAPVLACVNCIVTDVSGACDRLRSVGAEVIGALGALRSEVLQTADSLRPLADGVSWERVVETVQVVAALLQRITRGRRTARTPAEVEMMVELERIKQAAEAAKALADLTADQEREADVLCNRFWALLVATWRAYAEAKRRQGRIDNEDLQSEAVHLLQSCPGVLRRYRRRFRYLMVDEFQDTNPLQMRLIDLLHPSEPQPGEANNLFIVGDVQQSIYGFRNADATIFQGIERRFRQNGAGDHVSLAANFRSRPEILQFVNYLFGQIWRGEDDSFTPLEAGAQHHEKTAASLEFLLGGEMWRGAYLEGEADAIAAYVRRMVETEALTITDRAHPRCGQPVRYGDVAVLLRSLPDIERYERALVQRGVPYFVVGGGRGYYARHEVRDVMNVLTVLERPMDDIALAATLRSPMAGLDLQTIYSLAQFAREVTGEKQPSLYPRIRAFLETQRAPESEREALAAFHGMMEELRREEDRLPVGRLLERILRATGYDARVLVRPGGRRRLANVRKLVQMANAASSHGVSEFIQRLREIEKVSEQEGDAPTEEEASDVVRVMTIHKAKGLEFPVVFLGDMGRGLLHPERAIFLADPRTLAVGCKLGDYKTAAYRALEADRLERDRRETARVLYVALTRAREHLILCGSLQARKRGDNWADQVFPYVGLLAAPAEVESRIAAGGIAIRVLPTAVVRSMQAP